MSSFVTDGVCSKSRSQQSSKESKTELDKGNKFFFHRIHFYIYFFVDKLMKHYIFGQQVRWSIFIWFRKQVCHNVCQELVDHSDVEVVNQIPDKNQDNNDDDTNDDYDQKKLSNVDNLEGKSDNSMGSDKESVGSGNQDNLMEKTNLDTIHHKDNFINSVGCLQKNHTKKSIYDDYPALHNVIPINSHFSTKVFICSFEMYNGVYVAAYNIPLDRLTIPGK